MRKILLSTLAFAVGIGAAQAAEVVVGCATARRGRAPVCAAARITSSPDTTAGTVSLGEGQAPLVGMRMIAPNESPT